MKKTLFGIACALAFLAGCAKSDESAPATETTTKPAATEETAKPSAGAYDKVQATFTASCIGCHGSGRKAEGIDLSSYDAVMKGGEKGPIVVPGDPENSLLVHALRGTHGAKRMPLNGQPLPEAQIKEIEDWIKAGAKK